LFKDISAKQLIIFSATIICFVVTSLYAIRIDLPYIHFLPIILIGAFIAIKDFSLLFYFLIAALPISFEYQFGGSSLSMPTEPLMIGLLGISVVLFIQNRLQNNLEWKHLLILLIIAHIGLLCLNTILSPTHTLSFKYLLTKLWYYAAFVFIPILLLKKEGIYKKLFWLIFIPLILTVCYTIARHALKSFGFDEINIAARPFYANHVIYACTLGLMLPFVAMAIGWYKQKPFLLIILIGSVFLLLFAIVTSYTRTTWLSIIAAFGALIVFRSNYLKHAIVLGLICTVGFCYYLVDQNRYMKYAPDFQRTVFNHENFSKHMSATMEMKDVSGMERVYRWVAAVHLIEHNFWLGTGTNTFYPTYKIYANPAFITNVSDNPEHASTHNYFLLTFCEQGVFGFLLFTTLYLYAMIRCHFIYRTSKINVDRNIATACFLALVIFLVHLVLGDMVEVDKNGGIFWLCIAFIISLDTKTRKSIQA
jgi:hypothetical protein